MNVTKSDYLIIGAGPAGLQLGYFLEQVHRDYLILEAEAKPGSFFTQFPRHRQLISINKVYTGYDDPEINLRWDWNSLLSDSDAMRFKHYSRSYFPNTEDFARYLADFAAYFQLKIKYGVQVVKIAQDNSFLVIDDRGRVYAGKRLIIATGLSEAYVPPIPGIELTENYVDVSIDPEDFANQRVLIIGKGNSGFETADALVGTTSLIHIVSPTPVKMAWQSKYVGHLRAVNNNLLDTYQLKSQNSVLDATIAKIERHNGQFVVSFKYTHAHNEQEDLIYDRVIVCTGFQFNSSLFDDSCQPELAINDRFPAQTSEWESVNIPDLYFAGVLMHQRDFKKKQSGFIHGFRYNIKLLAQILDQKYYQQAIASEKINAHPESLTEAIIQRVNRSSGLWQQTGFLCDLITIAEDNFSAQYYQELSVDYVQDSPLSSKEHYLITLEFGSEVDQIANPFEIDRVHKEDTANAIDSAFIHPVIRHYDGKKLLAEHHIIEDLAGEWLEDVHIQPLLEFLRQQWQITQHNYNYHYCHLQTV